MLGDSVLQIGRASLISHLRRAAESLSGDTLDFECKVQRCMNYITHPHDNHLPMLAPPSFKHVWMRPAIEGTSFSADGYFWHARMTRFLQTSSWHNDSDNARFIVGAARHRGRENLAPDSNREQTSQSSS